MTGTGPGEEERVVRRDLAACYRMVAALGWDDLVATHISARVGSSDEFLINPFGMMFEEITASSLVRIDADGNVLDGSLYPINRAGFVIHSAVHLARPDVGCVIHLHTRDGAAVSALEDGLLPLNATAMTVVDDVAAHEFEGLSFDERERERLADDLGGKNRMLLRNHGTLTAGRTVAEAFWNMYSFEWACTVQVRALAMGRALHLVPDEVVARVGKQTPPDLIADFSQNTVWPAMLRKLDRDNPGYDA